MRRLLIKLALATSIGVCLHGSAQAATYDQCLYTLDPAAANALTLGLASTINAASCGLVVDSSSSTALNASGASRITAKYINVTGGDSITGASSVTPAPVLHATAQANPLTFLTAPTVGACTNTNVTVSGTTVTTLSPGTYCNGITISGSSRVTFNAGTYILLGGGLNVSQSATVTGSGVTFFLTQGTGHTYGPLSVGGSASVTISAPTAISSPYYGILFYQDPTIPAGSTASSLTGASSMKMTGALYFPTTGLTISGASSQGSYLLLVVNTLTVTGASTLNLGLPAGRSPLEPPVSVSVLPASSTLYAGQAQTFTATVNNSTQGVTWSLNPSVGSITSGGVYTAPATITVPQTVTVTATSVEDTTKTATATVTLNPTVTISAVTPATATLANGQTLQFAATVSGSSNTAITWTVSPATGTISGSGLYTAPASILAQQTVTVKATSVADTSKFSTAIVTLNPTVTISAVTPGTVTLTGGQTKQFAATVSGASNMAINWTINPTTAGTINASTGFYTAPASILAQQTVTVTATSAADGTKSSTAVITLNPTVTISAVTPATATLTGGQNQPFTATVSGASNTAINWTINPTTAGTINASTGFYTAPASILAQQTVTVTATSAADITKSSSATITLSPPITVTVTPGTATVNAGATRHMTATVAVTWKISPATGAGTIDPATGLYAAPACISAQQTVTVTATSVADTTKSGTATITLQFAGGYSFQRSLAIDHTKVPNTDQSNFPVLVTGTYPFLATTANGGHVTNANGYDLVFATDQTCNSPLKFEISQWNPATGLVEAWVQVPLLSHTTDTPVYLCYGNPNVTTFQGGPAGSVWDSNFKMVMHLPDGMTLSAADFTGNGNNGVIGAGVTAAAGEVNGGAVFNGSATAHIDVPNNSGLNLGNNWTIGGWFKAGALVNGSYQTLMGQRPSGATSSYSLVLETYNGGATSDFYAGFTAGANNFINSPPSSQKAVAGTWYHVAGTYDGANLKVYVNGSANSAAHSNTPDVTSAPVQIGQDGTGSDGILAGGAMDEVRISNIARSADWIGAEYNNQSSPSTFYLLGAENAGLNVTPATSSLLASQTQQFTALPGACASAAVNWTLGAGSAGSINASGLYTAPATFNSQQTLNVIATSQADGTQSGQATVTLIPVVTVAVTPLSATLAFGQTQQFTATVAGTTNPAMTWSINPNVGTISTGGLYTAPASLAATTVVTVTVASQADNTKTATASITVVAPVTISVSPTMATLYANQQKQFIATVNNASNTGVTWSLSSGAPGSISSSGLYTAPASIAAATVVTVTATSQADNSKTASATITLEPPLGMMISPTGVTLYPNQQQQFTASVTNVTNTGVTWSLSNGLGFVSPSGLYTAPAEVNSQQTTTIIATSQQDPSKSVTATVSLQGTANTITLSPFSAGPNVPGTAQTATAVLKNAAGSPISGVALQFLVTGVNANSASVVTDANGAANFAYTGAHAGTDNLQASYGGAFSNPVTVAWVNPAQPISTTTVTARVFGTDLFCSFDTLATTKPLFTMLVPTINFNPPAGVVPGAPSSINPTSRPMVDVMTDINGNYVGSITLQGNGVAAGADPLGAFQAVFTGTFNVAAAGPVAFNFFSDDAFVLGVGNGATRVSGVYTNIFASGMTPFENLPVMGGENTAAANGPAGYQVVVNFPAAGSYPYEVDYNECGGGDLAITMATGAATAQGVPPAGALTLSPNTVAGLVTGSSQSFSVLATDGSGNPVPNVMVGLVISGANASQLNAVTDATGRAAFSYAGVNAGTDSVQALGYLSGMDALSNVVTVQWPAASGGGTGGTPPVVPVSDGGWIGSPANGSTVSGVVPINVGQGEYLFSGTLKYAPVSDPTHAVVLNASVFGPGQIGTLDATLLKNGAYWIELNATGYGGVTQNNLALITVVGDYKPGRVTATVTDFMVPAPGLPVRIQRTYDSLERGTVSDFGYGWKLGIQVDLVTSPTGDVTFTMNGQRRTFYFTPPANGFFTYWYTPQYTGEPGLYGSLTTTGDNCSGVLIHVGTTWECAIENAGTQYQAVGYVYTDAYGRVYTIGPSGQLQSVKDLNGNTLTVTAGGITGSNGLSVPFVRDPATGRITTITDTLGKVYSYSYDTSGNLSTVTLPTDAGVPPIVTTYGYDPAGTHLLTSEKDPVGNSSSSKYYPDGKLQWIIDAKGQKTSYAYDLTTNTTTVTNPDGVGQVVTVADAYGMPLMVTDELGHVTKNTYDGNHNLLTTTDPLLNTTTYTYDTNGFRTTKKDALGHTWTTVNNQFGGPITLTDPTSVLPHVQNVQTVNYDAHFNVSSVTDLLGLVVAFTYNNQAQPLTMVDARGQTWNYSYDTFGNKMSQTDPRMRLIQYSYDTQGRLQSQTDPRGNMTFYGSDPLGRRTSMTDPYQKVTNYGYDGSGNKASETNARGYTTNYFYDELNRLKQVNYPDATSKTITYDFRGNKLTEVDQNNYTTQYMYDLAGRLTSVTVAYGTADAATTSYTYDDDNRKLTEVDPRGNTTRYKYDAAGRLTNIYDGAGNHTQYGYDEKNQRTSMLDAKMRTTTYGYDERGRQTSVLTPDNLTVNKTYDGAGSVTSMTDEELRTTQYKYDEAGELMKVIDALGQTTQYGYDGSGNKNLQIDANLNQTTYIYDKLNRRTSRTLPGMQMESMGYDEVGNMTSRVDFNGKTTTYAYDKLNRRVSKTPDASFTAPVVSFGYTNTGKRASMTDAVGTTNYSYTARDQVLTKATPQGTLSYSYDLSGNVASVVSSNANGTNVAYAWDADNRLKSVTDNRTSGVTNYSYDATSQVSSFAYPNGVTHTFGYDLRDRTTSLNVAGASPIAGYTQMFGFAGHKLSVAETGGRNDGFGYDPIYRLTSENISGASVSNGGLTYVLDPVGNRKSLASTLPGLAAQTFSYDVNDRLVSDSYDSNGNTVSSGGTDYTYEFEDRLVTASTGVTIVYDGDGNRVSETANGVTTKYLVDDLTPAKYAQVTEETVNGAAVAQFTYGLMRISQNRASGVSYYGYDAGGSVRELLNAAGVVTDTYEYDAFGNLVGQTGSTVNEFLYRGEQFDSGLSLYFLRARYYRPGTGRFLTRDSWETCGCVTCQCITEPIPNHKYLYASDDPVKNIDPTGHQTVVESGILIGALTLSTVTVAYNYEQRTHALGNLTSAAGSLAILAFSRTVEEVRQYIRCLQQLLLDNEACNQAYVGDFWGWYRCIMAAQARFFYCTGRIPGPVQ